MRALSMVICLMLIILTMVLTIFKIMSGIAKDLKNKE